MFINSSFIIAVWIIANVLKPQKHCSRRLISDKQKSSYGTIIDMLLNSGNRKNTEIYKCVIFSYHYNYCGDNDSRANQYHYAANYDGRNDDYR